MPQTLATHIVEIGRLRIGCQVPIQGGKNKGRPRPEKLKHWRLTSNNRTALETAARLYGGTVRDWKVPPEWQDQVRKPDHAFELFTETDTLDAIIHGDGLMETNFEIWKGAYCVRRCNGQFITKCGYGKLQGHPCQCPDDPQERRRLAMKGEACQDVSRICVVLPGMPLGQWRLDTRGFYAAAEIRGLQTFLRYAEMGRTALEATLRLEHRTDQKMVDGTGQTFNYPVVVIEPKAPAEVLLLEGQARRQYFLERGQAEAQKQLPEHIADVSDPVQPRPQGLPAPVDAPERAMAEQQHQRTAREAKEALELQIDVGLEALGQTSQQRTAWKGRTVRALKRARLMDCTVEELQTILERVLARIQEKAADAQAQAAHAAEAAQPPQPDAEPALPLEGEVVEDDAGEAPPETGPGPVPWRDQLHQFAQVLDQAELAQEASALAEDPEATEEMAQHLLQRINAYIDETTPQEGFPF